MGFRCFQLLLFRFHCLVEILLMHSWCSMKCLREFLSYWMTLSVRVFVSG
ncbi:hypothetical protein Hanom_Chr04g00300551 [Helianthus anomalus]